MIYSYVAIKFGDYRIVKKEKSVVLECFSGKDTLDCENWIPVKEPKSHEEVQALLTIMNNLIDRIENLQGENDELRERLT